MSACVIHVGRAPLAMPRQCALWLLYSSLGAVGDASIGLANRPQDLLCMRCCSLEEIDWAMIAPFRLAHTKALVSVPIGARPWRPEAAAHELALCLLGSSHSCRGDQQGPLCIKRGRRGIKARCA